MATAMPQEPISLDQGRGVPNKTKKHISPPSRKSNVRETPKVDDDDDPSTKHVHKQAATLIPDVATVTCTLCEQTRPKRDQEISKEQDLSRLKESKDSSGNDLDANHRKELCRQGRRSEDRAEDRTTIIMGCIAEGLPMKSFPGPYALSAGHSDYNTMMANSYKIKYQVMKQEELLEKWAWCCKVDMNGNITRRERRLEFQRSVARELPYDEHRRRFPWMHASTAKIKPNGSCRKPVAVGHKHLYMKDAISADDAAKLAIEEGAGLQAAYWSTHPEEKAHRDLEMAKIDVQQGNALEPQPKAAKKQYRVSKKQPKGFVAKSKVSVAATEAMDSEMKMAGKMEVPMGLMGGDIAIKREENDGNVAATVVNPVDDWLFV